MKAFGTDNRNVFITQNGLAINTSKSNCAISKQLNKYSKRFGKENINAHAIRRAYAKNLLNKGASIALMSKALGHSDLAVTTQYLDIDIEEVATNEIFYKSCPKAHRICKYFFEGLPSNIIRKDMAV